MTSKSLQLSQFAPAVTRAALAILLISSPATVLYAQFDPQKPAKEYIRLGGRVIAIENAESFKIAPPSRSRIGPAPEQAQFTASGTSGCTAVDWQITEPANFGSITAGQYSAPAASYVLAPTTVKIAATCGSESDHAEIVVSPVLYPSTMNVGAAGGNQTITVTTPGPWTAQASDSWIHNISPPSFEGNGELSFVVDPNPDLTPRPGTLTVGGIGLAINQAASTGVVTLTPTSYSWKYNETTQKHVSVSVSGTINWSPPTVTCSLPPCGWITVSNITSSAFDVSVATNASPNPRDGWVHAGNAQFYVLQSGMPGMRSLSPDSIPNASPAGETVSIAVGADPGFAWSASTNQNWIAITSATSGTGSGSLTVRIDPNPNPTVARDGAITVSGFQCPIHQAASTIYIDPNFVDWIYANNYYQFHAYVNGAERDSSFQWSVAGAGTISQSGLYRAPTSVSQNRQDIVIIKDPTTNQEAARAIVQLRVNPYGAGAYYYDPAYGAGAVAISKWFRLTAPAVMGSPPPHYVDLVYTKNPLGAGGTPTSLANSCHVRIVYSSGLARLALADDSDGGVDVESVGSFWSTSVPFGYSGILENSQCKVVGSVAYPLQGNPFQGWFYISDLAIQFKSAFSGHLATVSRYAWTYTTPIPWSSWTILGSWDAIGYQNPTVRLEAPAAGTALPPGTATVSGYAFDNEDFWDTPISKVEVSVDGQAPVLASYGQVRNDICGAFYNNRPNCPNVGYTYAWDTTTVSNGVHTIRVTATDSDPAPHSASAEISVTVNNPVQQKPDLSIAISHAGNFTQGQTGAAYAITVTNSGDAPTSGTVTVADGLPAGLVATSIAGAGWTCNVATVSCSRSDVLSAGSTYPSITLTVNVAANAPSTVTNSATVSGGGESNTANNAGTDPTSITQVADLVITVSHSGEFHQGQVGATYTLTVTNGGAGATNGVVTVTDNLPAGLTATGMSGVGWSCNGLSCSRSDVLSPNASFPPITVVVSVATDAPLSVSNSATVSGGGEVNSANNTASDPTTITPATESISTPTVAGPASGTTGVSYSYTATGATSNLGHPVQYQFTWGDGTNSGWLAAGTTSASHTWSTVNTYTVTVQARCATDTTILSAISSGVSVGVVAAEAVSTPTVTGTTSGQTDTAYTYTATGATSSYGHPVQYQFNWGDGTNSGWLAAGTTGASHTWSTANTYTVTVQARCATDTTVLSAVSSGVSVGVVAPETVSTPAVTGPTSGQTDTAYTYTASGATSSYGHSVQFQFNWGDGTNSGWLAVGTTGASHTWTTANTYTVTVQARCATDNTVVSAASTAISAVISAPETVSTPSVTGPTSGLTGTSYAYTASGAVSSYGHTVQYQFNWGDGTNSGWLPVGTQTAAHAWAAASTYSVTVLARCASDTSVVSAASTVLSTVISVPETVSTPAVSGPTSGLAGTSYTYTASGATSNYGHAVQYQFTWGDGTNSGWLPAGTTTASHTWTAAGSYSITVQARCATDVGAMSSPSNPLMYRASGIATITMGDYYRLSGDQTTGGTDPFCTPPNPATLHASLAYNTGSHGWIREYLRMISDEYGCEGDRTAENTFLRFNTSTLSGATITSATLNYYVSSWDTTLVVKNSSNNPERYNINWDYVTPSWPPVAADFLYAHWGAPDRSGTAAGPLGSSTRTTGWVSVTLSNLGNINKTGYTYLRGSMNVEPVMTLGANGYYGADLLTNSAGSRPYLTVTYTLP